MFVLPIMDVDNVATGNGGKRRPRAFTTATGMRSRSIRKSKPPSALKEFSKEGRLGLFIDLHNPAPGDKRPFFFVAPPSLLAPIGQLRRSGSWRPLRGRSRGRSPSWRSRGSPGRTHHPLWRQISGVWVNENGNPETVAVCLETSWNTPHSTTEGYRTVGRQLGLTIAEFVRVMPEAESK